MDIVIWSNKSFSIYQIYASSQYILWRVALLYRILSSVWLERCPDKTEVAGSNPALSNHVGGIAQLVVALLLQGRCQRFESAYLHFFTVFISIY